MVMRMQKHSHSFAFLLLMVFIAEIVLSGPLTPSRSRVRRQNMKVRISATGDTIVMKFLRPNADTKLEGYILGYGGSMFSKQFIQLPENGQPYETEFDAEPKYLIAVQPIPTNEVKKQCTGKVQLEKPLHLVIGSVTPTSVLLSWGTLLKTPYEGNIMDDCLEDGHYTVRYREKNRKWNYQTCPTRDTVIDNLKPNTLYEFGVQPSSKDGIGIWSKPVVHNISTGGTVEKVVRKIFKRPNNPGHQKPLIPSSLSFPFGPHHVLNKTQGRLPVSRIIVPKTTLAPPTTTRRESPSTPAPALPVVTKQPIGGGGLTRSGFPSLLKAPIAPKLLPPLYITTTMAFVPEPPTNREERGGRPLSQPQQKPLAQPLPTPQVTLRYRPQKKPQQKPQSVQLKPQPQPRPYSQMQSQFQPQTKPQPQPTSQTQPHPLPQQTSQTTPQTKPQPQPTSQTQPHPLPQQTSQPTPQTQAQQQPQLTTQPTPQTKAQPQPQLTSQPTPWTQPRLQPQPTSQPTTQTKPQPQPQPTSQPTTQTKPQPQPQPTSHHIRQTQRQPQVQPTSQTISQTQSQTQPKPQPKLQIQDESPSHPQLHPLRQTTPKHHSEAQPQPTPQLKQKIHNQTQPQLKTMTLPQLQVQSTTQPKYSSHPQTPQSIPQPKPHTEPELPKVHIQSKPQPNFQSTTQPQFQTQPQPQTTPELQLNTKQQSNGQPLPKPKNQNFSKSKPKTQPQSQSQPKPQIPAQPKKPEQKPKPKPQTWGQQQHQPKIQPRPQSQLPSMTKTHPVPHPQLITHTQPPPKTQTQYEPAPLPKPHAPSRPQPQPQPGLQFQPQTRTYSEPTKVTPRQAVSTAPSPPEEGKPLPRPALATEKAGSYNHGTGVIKSSVAEVPHSPITSSAPPAGKNTTLPRTRIPTHSTRIGVRPNSPSKTFTSSHSSSTPRAADGVHHRGNALPKPVVWSKEKPVLNPAQPVNKRPNLVGKPSNHDKPMDLKLGEKESILKPFPLVTAKPKQERRQQTTTSAPAINSSRFDIYENSSIFRPLPTSEVDIMGKKRFVAPHVIYKTDKKPDEPCSITTSLAYFPDEEGSDQNVTGPPRVPPSNLTVVTVEGCPSFVILDWQKSDNETREYEVVSTTKGPNGQEVSILTTNQTHTAVENLKPESSYEFTVTPRNELGAGPSSDPVSFSTESADPRVSEYVSGKDAIWTQFPFKADAYSECSGKQFVKRTWYRKFVGIQLCNSLRYKIYLSDSLNGKFYNIGDQTGHGEDHCQFVDSFLDGRTGSQLFADQLPSRQGFYRALRQEPVSFGEIGGNSHVTYVGWYECGTPIPGKW
ncbi:target of Nesh-SH3 isoform X3 [Mastacembelus armatus]|uniref:Target of Nesh-SH3-like n=1 Tax=Mastacembelus armatus TaxID=205130 RepID=A0A3Q3N0I6_9TELE|nr:target of Nesh-SH3-like isoform X3 [Mastacembelus armatus]